MRRNKGGVRQGGDDALVAKRSKPTGIDMPQGNIESFHEIARLIAGDDAPAWLGEHLRRWSPSLFLDRQVAAKQPTRSEMKAILAHVEAAASLLGRALSSMPVREFLEGAPLKPIANIGTLMRDLRDLAGRARTAADSAALSTEGGVTRAGRGKATLPGSYSPEVHCAIIIAETWKFFNGRELAPRSKKAAEAAAKYWRAAGGERSGWGDNPLNRWRYHFDRARGHSVAKARAEIRRHLLESRRLAQAESHAPVEGPSPANNLSNATRRSGHEPAPLA